MFLLVFVLICCYKAKSENIKQPKCPQEKENAIVEAQRHVQMIRSIVCPSDFQAGIFFCQKFEITTNCPRNRESKQLSGFGGSLLFIPL